ncbi:MAG: hypothetical protein ACJ8FP_26295 [Xanthobacteraceae bacterium]
MTYLQRPLTIIFATAFSPKKAAFAEAFIQVFTLDLRFHDTDLSKQECFVLTGDLRGLPGGGDPLGTSR